MPILGALALVFAVAFVLSAGQSAGHALWLPVVIVVLCFAALALWLWHRRALDHIRHLHLEHLSDGRWTQVSKFQAYPKRCVDCAHRAHTWREASAHDNPYTSPCAAMRERRLELEASEDAGHELAPDPGTRPGSGWKAEAMPNEREQEPPTEVLPGRPEHVLEPPVSEPLGPHERAQ